MKRCSTLLAALAVAAATTLSPSWAQEDEGTVTPQTLEELRDEILGVMRERELPAVGIAMVDESGPVWVTALGSANLEENRDADEYSMFRIGSTSKMLVSLAVLQLVEDGRLSLDDTLSDLAPEIEFENRWEESDPIRVVHLLEHTTGWDDIHLPEYAHNVYPAVSLKEGLDFHPHSRISRWVPGTRSSYCNAGPPVAAYIVEKVTGQDFEQYVQENFFDPMGMETTTYRYSEDVQARGVTLYANDNEPQEYWHIVMRPSGSINASPREMAKFVQLLVNRGVANGKRLVSPESLDRMERAASTSAARAGQEAGYGLGNYTHTHNGRVYHGHDGGVNGGITELAYLPEAGVGHVIMTTSDDVQAFRSITELVKNYETRNLAPVEIPEAVAVSDAHRQIEGLYYPINPRQQVGYFLERIFGVQRLWFEDGKLQRSSLLDASDVTVYLPASDTLYRDEESGIIALTQAHDPLAGRVVHVGMGVFRPVSALTAYGQLSVAALWAFAIVTSILYLLVWGVRRLRNKIPPGPTIRIRVWPLLAGLSIVGVVALFTHGMTDPFNMLGRPTAVSVSISLLTIAYAVFAAAGIFTAVKTRHVAMNRVNYWHSAVCAGVHFVVALYLAWFGVVGLATWA